MNEQTNTTETPAFVDTRRATRRQEAKLEAKVEQYQRNRKTFNMSALKGMSYSRSQIKRMTERTGSGVNGAYTKKELMQREQERHREIGEIPIALRLKAHEKKKKESRHTKRRLNARMEYEYGLLRDEQIGINPIYPNDGNIVARGSKEHKAWVELEKALRQKWMKRHEN